MREARTLAGGHRWRPGLGLDRLVPGLSGPIGRPGRAPSSTTAQLALRLALFAAWLAIVVVLASHHAPWRDEVRALSIALQGDGLVDMLAALRGDGHPALWYLLLRAAHSVTQSTVVLPVVSILIASLAVLILVLFSPFGIGLLAILLLGEFALFEYSVTARNYGISMLILFALAALYPRYRERGVVLGLLLLLLANTNVHSTLLAMAFLLFWLLDTVWAHGLRWTPALRTVMLNGCLVAVGAVLCFATVYPPYNDAVGGGFGGLGLKSLFRIVVRPFDGDLAFNGSWVALGLDPDGKGLAIDLLRLLASLVMLGSTFGLIRRPPAFAAALASLLLLSLFFVVIYRGDYRHQALWLVFLVTLYWIALLPGPGPQLAVPERWVRLAGKMQSVGAALFILLLVLQVPGGLSAVADVALDRPPFSRSRDLAALIASDPALDGATILADPDFLVETVPYYHDNPTYLPREARFGNVVRFTRQAQRRLALADLLAAARGIAAETRRPVLILLAEPLDPAAPPRVRKQSYAWEFVTTPEQAREFLAATRLLAQLGPAKKRTEGDYDVYLLEPPPAVLGP